MKKIVIFNVGGALSSYMQFGDKKIIIDLGSGNNFSPVNDFLIPLSEKIEFDKIKNKPKIDQLILSHLDKDHISEYEILLEKFTPQYITCPNNNPNQEDELKLNTNLLGEKNDIRDRILKDMSTRIPPLRSCLEEDMFLFYIKPGVCENNEDLVSGYANNISLVLFIKFGDKTLLLPGDISKEGMKYLIENDNEFYNILSNEGIDFLVAPHHGLQTSFSEDLFNAILGKKTRLNIISEKIREENSDENRSDVDGRYYKSDYSTGENDLYQYGIKTSGGHIVIDFSTDETNISVCTEIKDVINEFVE